ncbi:hypothetical protein GCM10010340_25070 [Streptomyces griseoloalbus]|nr:hypothetical protein GCM10010294_63160 [Streptomyces griseoloalbus]GGW45850.1 hypothetical protein GCM10010340_25070 [Streptomyces albaduncus]
MEPTEGCGCCTCAWVLGWLMTPFFRADSVTGASESAGGSGGGPEASPFPPFTLLGGEGSGAAGFIGRASQACLNQWLRRHDVRDSAGRLTGALHSEYQEGRRAPPNRSDGKLVPAGDPAPGRDGSSARP